MKYDVKFFQPHEFRCKCCKKGFVASYLVYFLDVLRSAWGGAVQVNSAFRCPKHNALVGGSSTSRHLIGCAADITPIYMSDLLPDFKQLVRRLVVSQAGNWELIDYPWGVHVAVPRSEAAEIWTGGSLVVTVH